VGAGAPCSEFKQKQKRLNQSQVQPGKGLGGTGGEGGVIATPPGPDSQVGFPLSLKKRETLARQTHVRNWEKSKRNFVSGGKKKKKKVENADNKSEFSGTRWGRAPGGKKEVNDNRKTSHRRLNGQKGLLRYQKKKTNFPWEGKKKAEKKS